jgi:hypothetical protein
MAEENKETTLTDAVSRAVESQDKSSVDIETKETQEQETKEPEAKEGEPELSPEDLLDIQHGRTILQALRDPEKAPLIIDFLARNAGYTKGTIETKQDVREAAADINSILEKNLGEEFKFLAPKLGPAIKETLEAMLKSGQYNNDNTDLRARLEKQELKEIQNETLKAHVAISQEWFGSDDMPQNIIQEMSKAMDEFPPTDPNMAPERYYRKIFSLVAGEQGLTKKGRASVDKISRNQGDRVARDLASQNRGVTPNMDGSNPRKLSLKDAVSLAMEQVEQASRK